MLVEIDNASLGHTEDKDNAYYAKAYGELDKFVKSEGLFRAQPFYYVREVVLAVGLFGLSWYFVVVLDALYLQILNALLMSVGSVLFAFLGHDAGHRQIFRPAGRNDARRAARKNDLVSHVVGFIIGMLPDWWDDKHNKHHRYPNVRGKDDDIEVELLAFTEEQALGKKRLLYRLSVRYQHIFFYFPILPVSAVAFQGASAVYLFRKKRTLKYPVAGPWLLALHSLLYFGLLYILMGPVHAVFFIIVHQAFFGICIGSVFAPNHKGMPVYDKDTEPGFAQLQVLTARDVTGGPITDRIYGGLNYQIEHHLFPQMSRNNLRKVRPFVIDFCKKTGLTYHEVGAWQSQREIAGHLRKIGLFLRGKVQTVRL